MKKRISIVLTGIAMLLAAYWTYNKFVSPTRIALVNYPDFLYSKMAGAANSSFIKFDDVEQGELSGLKKYDMLFFFGMGLKLTAEQEAMIKNLGEKGMPVFLQASTTKGLELNTLSEKDELAVDAYLKNAGNRNYRNLFNYVRVNIDGKKAFTEMPDSAVNIASDVLFHIDEDEVFEKVSNFEEYCQNNNFHQQGNKKVVLFTSIPGPFNTDRGYLNSLIRELESKKFNVYPIAGFRGKLNYMKEINPDLIVYLPHGRLSLGGGSADAITEYLEQQNVPILCPLTVHQLEDDWKADRQGMIGGLLSQSVTMPEFDGGIAPYAVFTQHVTDKGLVIFKAIPERLKKFGDMAEKYVRLKDLKNSDKKVAFVYFKGPGKNALVAANMEVLPSLHNVLLRLKKEGYNLGDMPEDYPSFEKRVLTEGPVFGAYAEGAFDNYLKEGRPALVPVENYKQWCAETLPVEMINDVEERYGKAPGAYMSVYENQKEYIAVARVQFGNVVILPQPLPGLGDNIFELVHGAKVAPPHTYIAAYLWLQKAFQSDALFHFGTHGSVEFTPGKQIALSDYDWTDPLIGTAPHNYVYTISNIGEAMIAKRRSYAATQNHLTPPFIKADAASAQKQLVQTIDHWSQAKGAIKRQYALSAKKMVVEEGIHQELQLDDNLDSPYTDDEMMQISGFLAQLDTEKVPGGLYTLGNTYTPELLNETVLMMFSDALAIVLSELDETKGLITKEELRNELLFRNKYTKPAEEYVQQILKSGTVNPVRNKIITAEEYRKAVFYNKEYAMGWSEKGDTLDPAEEAFAKAVLNVENTLKSVLSKKEELKESTEAEMKAIINALNGGYTPPGPGGDPVANPESAPTGRNLVSINAEQTPTRQAWEVAKRLTADMLENYQSKHGGELPKKISFTLWSGSFVESEGTTIAQILYMLGIEPVWTPRGKVNDIRLIPAEELGRPRIDVVVQTSGQLRDLAASRLFLINRAIKMAADANDENNFVASGRAEAEKFLIEKGFSPKDAREMAGHRVFGGINGNYGASIMGMVEKSDRWDSTQTVAQTYINNMGAVYGSEDAWGEFSKGIFEAALLNTEAVVQPRQSNTWGALSLDHVYEFMGGLNLAIKEVTGNDAESYFNDFRNSGKPKVQSLKEAIGVESRTTLMNPRYIQEMMKGSASSAEVFAETFRNTFGWNVMKPSAIDDHLWEGLYDVYVQDNLQLNVHEFFERENPYALQEMTAVMLETVRKNMWKASPEQVKAMAELHASLVKKHQAGCSGFVCDNAKLRDFIAQNLSEELNESYQQEIEQVREVSAEQTEKNVVLKKDEEKIQPETQREINLSTNKKLLFGAGLALLVLLFVFIRKRKK